MNRPNVVYPSINIRKIKFIAYIYICFNQNLEKKSYISVKNEAVKQLHAVFLLTAEQCDIQSDCKESSELQIRGSYEDNSKIIFLIFQQKHML